MAITHLVSCLCCWRHLVHCTQCMCEGRGRGSEGLPPGFACRSVQLAGIFQSPSDGLRLPTWCPEDNLSDRTIGLHLKERDNNEFRGQYEPKQSYNFQSAPQRPSANHQVPQESLPVIKAKVKNVTICIGCFRVRCLRLEPHIYVASVCQLRKLR